MLLGFPDGNAWCCSEVFVYQGCFFRCRHYFCLLAIWLTLIPVCYWENWEPVCKIDIWLLRSLEASGWILVKGSKQRPLAEGQSSPWGVPVWPWSALLWVSGTPMASGGDLGLQLGPPGRSPLHFTLTPCTLACCQRVSFPVAGN